MADEKTNPTPKAEGAKTDTMHSDPDTPDRAAGEGDQTGVSDRAATAPPSAGGSAGAERPGKEVIKTKDAGTLVTDIPDMDEEQEEGRDTSPVNPGQEAPDVVGRQPYESRDEAKERIAEQSKERDKRQSERSSARTTRKTERQASKSK